MEEKNGKNDELLKYVTENDITNYPQFRMYFDLLGYTDDDLKSFLFDINNMIYSQVFKIINDLLSNYDDFDELIDNTIINRMLYRGTSSYYTVKFVSEMSNVDYEKTIMNLELRKPKIILKYLLRYDFSRVDYRYAEDLLVIVKRVLDRWEKRKEKLSNLTLIYDKLKKRYDEFRNMMEFKK